MNKAGILCLLFLSWLVACSSETSKSNLPLSLPINIQKEGSILNTSLIVKEHREYWFALRFEYDENDKKEKMRVRKLMGSSGVDKYGEYIDTGVPVPLRITVYRAQENGEKQILDYQTSKLEWIAHGNGYVLKKIVFQTLEPGHYRVRVESMESVSALDGVQVIFSASYHPKATQIK